MLFKIEKRRIKQDKNNESSMLLENNLKNQDDLQCFHYSYYRLFDWLTHSQGIGDYLLQEVPSLNPENETVHQLIEAFKEQNFIEFKEELMSLQTKHLSDGLNRVLQTFKKFFPYFQILLSIQLFQMDLLKGLTTRLRYLKETLMANSSFTHFRNRILLMPKLFTPTTKKGIKQPDAA